MSIVAAAIPITTLLITAVLAAPAPAAVAEWNPEIDVGLPSAHIVRRSAGSHFGYQGIHGPAHWEGTCDTGTAQSPINLPAMTPNGVPSDLALHLVDLTSPLEVTNNGHTFQVQREGGGGT